MNHNSPIALEGLPFFFPLLALTGAAFYWGCFWTGALLASLSLFVLCFFRNPERQTPPGDQYVISPADGKIVQIETVTGHDLLAGPLVKIAIFMNVFNVHVNRAPCAGTVEDIRYYPGAFLSADLDKASEKNERSALLIRRPDGRAVVAVQIAGLIARRIVRWVETGTSLATGERFGLIRFGSRVDVYMPLGTRPLVQMGQSVRAGETILGELP